jgi:hypothetical protein
MMWQDAVFFAGQVLFALLLVPTLLNRMKLARVTCAGNALLLLVFAAAYASLGLWFSAASTAACGLLWGVLFAQGRDSKWT